MAGRPLNPAWVIPTWAPNAAYPSSADPWSVTPTKATHPGAASVGFTPKAGVPAQCVNKVVADAYATDQSAKDYVGNSLMSYVGQSAALNFSRSFGAQTRWYAKFNPVTREWFGTNIVVNDDIRVTTNIEVWPATITVPAGALTAQKPFDLDFAANGDMLCVTDALDNNITRTVGGVWAKQTGTMGNDPAKPNVRYEPVSGRWVAAFRGAGAGLFVYTSTNLGALWTSRTPPTFTALSYVTLGSNKTGRLVMQGFLGTNCQFSYSDDGGTTWSAPQTIALGFTWAVPNVLSKPVFTGSKWAAIATDGTGNTRVFSSADGATWTSVLLNTSFNQIAEAGELLVMTQKGAGGGLVISVDGGATWQWTDIVFSASDTPAWIAFNGVRLAIFSTPNVYPGPGYGLGLANVT